MEDERIDGGVFQVKGVKGGTEGMEWDNKKGKARRKNEGE